VRATTTTPRSLRGNGHGGLAARRLGRKRLPGKMVEEVEEEEEWEQE
jgi:hypothetical protein